MKYPVGVCAGLLVILLVALSATSPLYLRPQVRNDIVGPRAFLKAVNPVAGEDYRAMFPLRVDWEMMPVTMEDGRQVVVFGDRLTAYVSPRGEITGFPQQVEAYRALLDARSRRDGVRVTRRPDGARFESTWRAGVEEGPFRAYYPTGELWAEATSVAGRPVGRHVVYDRAGTIIHETTFAPRMTDPAPR